jgi:hypothetical protein
MRHPFFAALLVVSCIALGSAPAVAQADNNSTAATNNSTAVLDADDVRRLANVTDGNLSVSPNGSLSIETATATPAPSPQPTPPSTSTPTPAASTPTASSSSTNGTTERIDSQTVIVSSSVRNGSAVITLRSSASQSITLTDAGDFRSGGVVGSRTIAVRGGETTTVEFPVTEQDGMVGVGISTEQTTLYAEIIERGGGGGLGVLRVLSSLQAWLAGAGVAFIWMIIAGWTVMRSENGRPEVA